MGKQINFYLTALDEREFFLALAAFGPFHVYRLTAKCRGEHVRLVDGVLENKVPIDAYGVAVGMEGNEKALVYDSLPKDGELSLDKGDSEIISLSRCRMLDENRKPDPQGRLGCGRIWYSEKKLFGEPKSEKFVSWAGSVLRWCRRNYHKGGEHGLHFGPDAMAKYKAGTLSVSPG